MRIGTKLEQQRKIVLIILIVYLTKLHLLVIIFHNKSLMQRSTNLKKKNPFISSLKKEQEAASEGYRYRRWKLGDDITLVARTSINAFITKPGVSGQPPQMKFVTIRSLNQFDSKLSGGVDWREKLESQSGAVLATEMKNNAKKVTRWIAEAVLAGADEIRIGYVARKSAKDPYRHDILKVEKVIKPDTLASSARLRITHLWGVLKELIDAIRKLPDGKYLFLKDPNEPKLQLYSIPQNSFAGEEGDPFHDSPTGLGQDKDKDKDKDKSSTVPSAKQK